MMPDPDLTLKLEEFEIITALLSEWRASRIPGRMSGRTFVASYGLDPKRCKIMLDDEKLVVEQEGGVGGHKITITCDTPFWRRVPAVR
ncbi:TPA: hypothetical protein DIV48_01590 [Candidatus Kaiserbacteria bacterium]|nr:MAG: hypothetical protein UY93_C0002G0342 [Parcubacteria group bacterium GW2011_GWA1_56_13]KKW46226.1 MAG: hypothetical protein UY97_C0008G0013 [Parcubacteria group bacterium GW2011_GWB1_57_6]HCR52326.1 hypothetical protein [Candidatus Kaiserbacteria bacterium]